ncbi:hypothetical protein P5V15_010074 [Pogonomyrmex californicus]
MEDHHYTLSNNHIDDSMIYVEDTESTNENIASEQKDSDDYLIELYKERRYLYDHNHQDFKNKLIKENAWIEISVIMQEKNLGKHYTPEYCQTRCTSLRDQYSREKRNTKSESIYSKRKTFVFFSQLSFLDNYIKRRKTFSTIKRKRNAFRFIKDTEVNSITLEKYSNKSTDKSEYKQHNAIKLPHKRDINVWQDVSQDIKNFEQSHVNYNKEINGTRLKNHKIDQSVNTDDTFINNSMTFHESVKKNTTETKTVDQSFADYVRVHLENIPESEKLIRRKMIIDALSAPLPKT